MTRHVDVVEGQMLVIQLVEVEGVSRDLHRGQVSVSTRTRVYGGQVAAPVFSRVMSGALRLMAVPPDDLPLPETLQMAAGGPA